MIPAPTTELTRKIEDLLNEGLTDTQVVNRLRLTSKIEYMRVIRRLMDRSDERIGG